MTEPVSIAPWSDLSAPLTPDSAFVRLWRGFATARVAIAMALLTLMTALYMLGTPSNLGQWLIALSAGYLAATLSVRLLMPPLPHGKSLDLQWASTIGLDLVYFSGLQFVQAGGLTYSPLFAVPVLMAAVLGSAMLALGTAAVVTLLMLTNVWLESLAQAGEAAARFTQAGLTGIGYFALAFLANHLAMRLAGEEKAALRSRNATRIQAQVSELVIETLSEGVLVVNSRGEVQAANPSARVLLGSLQGLPLRSFNLAGRPAWQPLMELADLTFLRRDPQSGEVALAEPAGQPRRMVVRTRLTPSHGDQTDRLCVLFLEDLRVMEARLRTEKLAAMGRMSAAVAHEIRNPLAAITQANALLDEDLSDPAQRQLSALVRQNAQRLAQIVDEILNIFRVQHQGAVNSPPVLELDTAAAAVCADWSGQTGSGARLQLTCSAGEARIAFDPDHLRRVLVNLLDNALRYASHAGGAIQVATSVNGPQAGLQVWSDGASLEPTVQRHLFEPFFSSESRSSGLGLYICRELCERHGAQIGYRRSTSPAQPPREGNSFFVSFRACAPLPAPEPALTQ